MNHILAGSISLDSNFNLTKKKKKDRAPVTFSIYALHTKKIRASMYMIHV
jgi:hypothetical protein